MSLARSLNLLPDEELLHTACTSWWSQTSLLAIGLALLPLAGVGALVLVRAWWQVQSNCVWVTTRRLVWEQGLLDRRVVEVRLQRVYAVVEQTLNQRLLNFGTVDVGAGALGRIRVESVAAPNALRSAIAHAQILLLM